MTIHEQTAEKIRHLPAPLVEEVSTFIDFLLLRQDDTRWQLWLQFSEAVESVESDIRDYLPNLEDYEERLARGEITW
jgi:hypothetical protein